jgi:uncharacterized metal-binding protein YceD (DUF177 family)
MRPHLPASTRTTLGFDLSESSDSDDLVPVERALQIAQLLQCSRCFEPQELELVVGAQGGQDRVQSTRWSGC